MLTKRYAIIVLMLVIAIPAIADWVTTTIPVGDEPFGIAVNPVTNKIYQVNILSDSMTVIDGATNVTTNVMVGDSARNVAVNPVTNQIYVSNWSDTNVTVIDGATNSTTTVPTGFEPGVIAVNSVTNKIYVANWGNDNITVIDGATNDTALVSVGDAPCAIAVNSVTNKIYVANRYSATVTVIDGATNQTQTVNCYLGDWLSSIAVNPVTNKIYVVNEDYHWLTIIDGVTNTTQEIRLGWEPTSVAVNPVTNKIYVANNWDNSITVVDGFTNTTQTVAVGGEPVKVAVNVVTNKIYVANYSSNNITVIDGATNDTTILSAGTNPHQMVVNPVTNKIYAANRYSDNVTVIDGATNVTASVNAGDGPKAVAVNPITNKIYVANAYNDNVTVIDGVTHGTNTISVGDEPRAIAVNPVSNKIYVANWFSDNVTVIDGATDTTTTIVAGDLPTAIAINVVTNKIYVANWISGSVTVIDGTTNNTKTISVGDVPLSVAVNPVTNKIYVANNLSDNVTVINGATNVTATVSVGSSPNAIVVNPITNKIYVENYSSRTVTVIDGATNTTTSVEVGILPRAIVVNPVTNKIYVANSNSNNVTVIDGATNTTTTVGVGNTPLALACNPVTNKIYVVNSVSFDVTVIDGATNTTFTLPIGSGICAVAVEPVTNKFYIASEDGNVTVIDESPINDTKVRVVISYPSGDTTLLARPTLSGKGVNRSIPNRNRMMGVLNRINSAQLPWTWAQITSGAGTDSIQWQWNWDSDSLLPGENLVCALPLESDAGTTNNEGLGTPFAGNIQVYPLYRIDHQDVGITKVLAPTGPIDSGSVITPACSVYNYGNLNAAYAVRMRIGDFYDQTSTVNNHNPGTMQYVTFPEYSTWLRGNHIVSCSTELVDDINQLNDKDTTSILVSVIDIGVATIITPTGTIDSGSVITPQVKVKNYGTNSASFPVWFKIHSTSKQLTIKDNALSNSRNISINSTQNNARSFKNLKILPIASNLMRTVESGFDQIYEDSVWINLNLGDSTICSFESWDAMIPDTYQLESYTLLNNDANPFNDTGLGSVVVGWPVHDVGIMSILAPIGIIDSGPVITPKAITKNFGTIQENLAVRFKIGDFYTDATIITLGAGIIDTVEFTPWNAIQVGTHITKCTTLLASDTNRTNDFIRDSVRVRRIVGIDESDYTPPLPQFFTLENNRPNPFGSQTFICYALPKECYIRLEIYNASGVRVRTLNDGIDQPGFYRFIWNGNDDKGKAVAKGIYFYRIEADEFKATRKMIKLE